MKNTDGNHEKHSKVVPVPPFFRVFRAFRGSNSLMLYIITGTEKPNQEAITTENTESTEGLCLCFLYSVFLCGSQHNFCKLVSLSERSE